MVRKYSNYLSLYDKCFERLSGRRPRLLEIGVQHGGSLAMWHEYFGGDVDIIGVDILPECKKFETANIKIFIGDQSDVKFLESLSRDIGKVDVIIDDGSHICAHQIRTFEALFYKNLADDGTYVVEDCHTSYHRDFGGGLRRRGSFIEYAKRLGDATNAWYAHCAALPVTDATKWIESVTFASSVVVIQKRPMTCPEVISSGKPQLDFSRTFGEGRLANALEFFRKFSFIRKLVRSNEFLWRLMRRAIK
jgi:hypothetical protein